MSVAKVNIVSVELDEPLDEAGFWNLGATVGPRMGARRIGASVYEARAGTPIWPYHYHYGVEEWVYVIAGAPVLRDPAGERVLRPGDLVAFPPGHVGAHTLQGPGRFVIFSTGHSVEPFMSVYPDSGKISGPEGMLLLSSAVGYWHGEGTVGQAEPDGPRREPARTPPQPVVNLHAAAGELGALLGAERLDATVVELDPGQASEPYHYTYGREEWLLVLAGAPTLRHPQGEDELEPGDVVCFPEGPDGAHELPNRGESSVRALCLTTTGLPANAFYPDTGQWRIRNAAGQDEVVS